MTRNWMIKIREDRGLSLRGMAILCDCSVTPLYKVECGSITHPDIASDIARAYGVDVNHYNMLVADCHRAKEIPKHKPKPVDHGLSIYSYGGGI